MSLSIITLLAALPLLASDDQVAGQPYTKLETRDATRAAMLRLLNPQEVAWGEWFQCGPFPYAGHGRGDLARPQGPEVELARMRAGEALNLEASYGGKSEMVASWLSLGHVAGERIDLHRYEGDDLQDLVAGYLYTTIESPSDQTLDVTLGSDDGIRLWLNGKLLLDKDVPRGLNPTDDALSLPLLEGTNDLLIKVVDGFGGWEFQMLAGRKLDARMEVQLDFLLDRDFPVTPMRAHYTVTTVPVPQDLVVEVGGLDVLPDGRPAVATRRGDVLIVDEAYGMPPTDAKFRPFAEGLHEPLGLEWRQENGQLALYTVQRGELTRLVDGDGDGVAEIYETACADWGVSGNYHEFAFGPKYDLDGNAWVTLNVGFCGSLGKAVVPYRGWAVKITPEGEMIPVCSGLRSPNGIGRWKDGEMFYVDNQGDYVATNRLSHLRPGSFQGHPAGLRWEADYDPESPAKPDPQRAAVWFPYRKMGQSAADVVLDSTGGNFGPFADQFFVGDQMMATVMRVDLEEVNGHYQGACFPFIEQLDSGVNRMAFAPDGSMFVGQTDRGWGSIGKKSFGLQRIAWNGSTPFEIATMRAMSDGFELHFTEDVDPGSVLDPNSYEMTSYTYVYHSNYGAPESDVESVKIRSVEQVDRRTVRLRLESMRAGYVHELHAMGVHNAAGQPLIHSDAYYTLMEVPQGDIAMEQALASRPERLLFLTHSAGFEHGVVKRAAPSQPSVAELGLVMAAGDRYEVTVTKECSLIRADVLKDYDAVLFYTTGELPIEEQHLAELIDWVAEGGAFVGIHCATDTLYKYKPYMDMIGGAFDGHPWHEDVSLKVEDGSHPSTEHLGSTWELKDEIYQFKWFRRFPLHGLLSLSGTKADLSKGKRADRDNVNAWCKSWGEGRVFYTALGHRPELWSDETFMTHLFGGIEWAIHGPDTPVLPPAGARQLLASEDLSAWVHPQGRDAEWSLADGVLSVAPGKGNLFSKERFGDALIHVEFSPPPTPADTSWQGKGNSGVYVMGQYELQVLDSYGLEPRMGDCGAIYGVALPQVTPYRKAGEWSYYDIEFRAPRFDADGNKTENARITAWLNGRLIHEDVEVPGPTAASWRGDEFPMGPLMLQDHGNPVRYRNVWVLPR